MAVTSAVLPGCRASHARASHSLRPHRCRLTFWVTDNSRQGDHGVSRNFRLLMASLLRAGCSGGSAFQLCTVKCLPGLIHLVDIQTAAWAGLLPGLVALTLTPRAMRREGTFTDQSALLTRQKQGMRTMSSDLSLTQPQEYPQQTDKSLGVVQALGARKCTARGGVCQQGM